MSRWILMACVLVCLLSLPSTVSADSPTCYACGPEAGCFESSVPNFSQHGCEKRCFYFAGREICLCRTFGAYCIQSPDDPLQDNPLSPTVVHSMTSSLHRQLNEHLGEDVGILFDQHLVMNHLGTSRGKAAAEGDEGSMTQLYEFVATAKLTVDGVHQRVELKGHPSLRVITATFFDEGRRVALELETDRRISRVELTSP